MHKVKITITLALSFVCAITYAQINFVKDKDWNTVLAQAKAENKLVFADVYTSWCGPCKRMDFEIFPLPQVGTLYNTTFINYKLDAEKSEGPAIAKKYSVGTYPNYLFVNGDGVLIYRVDGYKEASEFIRTAKNALAEAKQPQTIVQLDALYPAHKTDKAFIFTYLTRRTALKLPTAELLDEYETMLTPAEQAETANIKLIAENGLWLNQKLQLGVAFEVLKRHDDILKQLNEQKIINENLSSIQANAMEASLKKAIETKDDRLFEVLKNLKKDFKANPFQNKQTLMLEYYYGTKNFARYKATAKDFINNYLLKIPADTLAKWDSEVYNEEKIYLQKQNNPKYNNAEYLRGYTHTQTIQLTRILSDVSEMMAAMTLTAADIQDIKTWSTKSVNITVTDTSFYKYVQPMYKKVQALVWYKAGQKQAAVKQMDQLIAENSGNSQAQDYFAKAKAKMTGAEK